MSWGRSCWDIQAVFAAQTAACLPLDKTPRQVLAICAFASIGSAPMCMCVCLCRPLNDLKVFYSFRTAELSSFSGLSPWNIHASANANQWKQSSGGARLLLKMGFCRRDLRLKKAVSIGHVMLMIKGLSSERAIFSEPDSFSSGYLFFNQSPWSEMLCLGALRHLLICLVPLEEELWSVR